VANDLFVIYKEHSYCRESVQHVLVKMLKKVTPIAHGCKLLERISNELLG